MPFFLDLKRIALLCEFTAGTGEGTVEPRSVSRPRGRCLTHSTVDLPAGPVQSSFRAPDSEIAGTNCLGVSGNLVNFSSDLEVSPFRHTLVNWYMSRKGMLLWKELFTKHWRFSDSSLNPERRNLHSEKCSWDIFAGILVL